MIMMMMIMMMNIEQDAIQLLNLNFDHDYITKKTFIKCSVQDHDVYNAGCSLDQQYFQYGPIFLSDLSNSSDPTRLRSGAPAPVPLWEYATGVLPNSPVSPLHTKVALRNMVSR